MSNAILAQSATEINTPFWVGFDLFLRNQPISACASDEEVRGWMYGTNSAALATMPVDFIEGLRDLAAGAPRHCPQGIDWAAVEDQPWN